MKQNPPAPGQPRAPLCLAAALAVAALTPGVSLAETLYGLTTGGNLISFDSASPGTLTSSVAVTGLGGDSLIGIDWRPATGVIYGVSTGSFIFTIDPVTGAATQGSALSTAATGTVFGYDFNPVPDRLRVVSDAEQNLRINVATGATTVDGSLSYAVGDANFGANPNVVAVAYTNPDTNPATGTTLYGIDSNLDVLVLQNPPNDGLLSTIGALGVDASAMSAFDISVSGTAWATFGGSANLYAIDLGTGAATLVGQIGDGTAVHGLTAVPEPEEYAAIFGAAMAGFALYRRQRRRA